MEYFNSCGGSPVAAAIGLAVLRAVHEDGLQRNALEVGGYLKARLAELAAVHSCIGDVRGLGLFIGVELVKDHTTLEPAGDLASEVANAMRKRRILISTDGPLHNVLKLKPPLPFSMSDADAVANALDVVFWECWTRRRSKM